MQCWFGLTRPSAWSLQDKFHMWARRMLKSLGWKESSLAFPNIKPFKSVGHVGLRRAEVKKKSGDQTGEAWSIEVRWQLNMQNVAQDGKYVAHQMLYNYNSS